MDRASWIAVLAGDYIPRMRVMDLLSVGYYMVKVTSGLAVPRNANRVS
jgi:hypothetical protein